MAVRVADKLQQFNNGTYMLMDASAVEYKLANGGTTSVQQVLDNGLTGGTVTSNQLSLITNSQYFKISITKNNPAWYGSLKFSYLYGTTPTEVDITITPTLNYTISKGSNTISSITYTIDGANITIGIKCTTTMYGTQTVEMPSEFGTINSLTAEEFTGDTTATLKENDSRGVITSLNALNLTAGATFQDVVDKLPKGGSALLGVTEFTNYQTIFPYEEGNDQFARVHIVKGTADGSRMYARWFRKDGVKEAIAIFNINDNKFDGWRILKDQRVYTSLSELGLTSNATVEDVVNTLKNGESFLAPVNTFTNYETIFPNKVPNDQWNKIHITKGTSLSSSHIRCFSPSGACEYLANVNNSNIVGWIDVSGTYIDISDAIIGKLGTEILKYPVGKYRINSTAIGNKFTDLPSDAEIKCGTIEVNGTAVGKSPFTDTWVYRMYKFECLTGTSSYVRRLNSGATVGQIEVDTGWQQIITENSKTDPYSCTGYTVLTGTEDLFTLPCGHYATAKADTTYNYPITDSSNVTAHIYVLGCLNDPANNKGYRIILYFDNKDRMYRINEWWGNFSNGWQEIQTGSTKATLVTNPTSLKLDITKKNVAWYGVFRINYMYSGSLVEMDLAITGTGNVNWSTISGKEYVTKVTYTQEENNKAHYTFGIVFQGAVYGVQQVEVIGDFAQINELSGVTSGIAFTGANTATKNYPVGKNNGVTLIGKVEDLGLTSPCTTVQIVQQLRNKSNTTPASSIIAVINNGGKTITDAPSDYGLLEVAYHGHDRVLIRYDGISSSTYAGSWIGKIKGSNGTFSSITWGKLLLEENLSELNTKITTIENITNTNAIKNIADNTLTVTSSTFKVVINTPTSSGYWFIKFKYYIGGKEYEALIMSEVYDRYWSGNAALVSSITSSASSQTDGTWNFSVGIKLSSSVTGVKIAECPSVAALVSFTTENFTGANTHEKKS